jgi:hypothetical protein
MSDLIEERRCLKHHVPPRADRLRTWPPHRIREVWDRYLAVKRYVNPCDRPLGLLDPVRDCPCHASDLGPPPRTRD